MRTLITICILLFLIAGGLVLWSVSPHRSYGLTAEWLDQQIVADGDRVTFMGMAPGGELLKDSGMNWRRHGGEGCEHAHLQIVSFPKVPVSVSVAAAKDRIVSVRADFNSFAGPDAPWWKDFIYSADETEELHRRLLDLLQQRFGEPSGTLKTEDAESWPRHSTIWSVGEAILQLTLYQSNDSRGVCLELQQNDGAGDSLTP